MNGRATRKCPYFGHTCKYWLVILSILALISKGEAVDVNTANISKFIDSLSKNGYDRRIRPSQSATNVTLQIALIALGPISLLTTSVRCDVILRQWWSDPRLNFDNQTEINFNGNPSSLIWIPDTYVTNAIKISSPKGTTETMRTTIGPNGSVYLSTRLTVEFSCQMNFRLYPMDKQLCSLMFESYAFTQQELELKWKNNNPVEYDSKSLTISGYSVESIKAETAQRQYLGNQNFEIAGLQFRFRRLLPNYVYHIYIPTMFLVALSWCTFWISASAVPARVTLIVTNFLSTMLLFNNIGNSVPDVSYITALEVFALTNAICIIFAMLEYVVVLRYPNFGSKGFVKPARSNGRSKDVIGGKPDAEGIAIKSFKDCVTQIIEQRAASKEPHIVDKYSRLLFPIIYMSYVAAYFSYCLSN